MSGTKRDASEMQEEVSRLEIRLKAARKALKIEQLGNALRDTTCVICSEELSECILSDMSLCCYECRCSTPRVVHTKCFTRSFRCSCSKMLQSPAESNKRAMQPVLHKLDFVTTMGMLMTSNLESAKMDIKRLGDLLSNLSSKTPEEVTTTFNAVKSSFPGIADKVSLMTNEASSSLSTLKELGYENDSDDDDEESNEESSEEGEEEDAPNVFNLPRVS